jgi:hypothetical protein
MRMRKTTSGGQALVMVTLALLAMCGLLGLAVDLGWSYFVQRQAQAAADGAALAAVAEAYSNRTMATPFVCGAASSNTDVFCSPAPIDCSTALGTPASNLANGCEYAKRNGFETGGQNGRQNATIQANDSSVLPTIPFGVNGCQTAGGCPMGVNDIRYWVTVRTVQTIPQLFSAVLGNREGTVSAIATAGIVAAVVPGSFWGLNEAGDYMMSPATGARQNYGVDVDATGSQAKNSPCPGGGGNGTICAADGMYLSSICNGTSTPGCQDPGGKGNNFAGETQGGGSVYSATTLIRGQGWVDDPSAWTPAPVNNAPASYSLDPTRNKAQPPLVASGSFGTCGVPNGVINGSSKGAPALTMGRYQYYSYHTAGNTTVIDGAPITVNGNVQFTAGGGCSCPGCTVSGPEASGSLPQYIFYGGMAVSSSNANINFGPGQYVMAGQSNANGSVFILGDPNNSGSSNPTITGASTGGGTMFLFTDANYNLNNTSNPSGPSLADLRSGTVLANATMTTTYGTGTIGTVLKQGSIDLKTGNSASVTLYGVDKNGAPALSDYNGFLFWQDRRNSIVNYDLLTGKYLDGTAALSSDAEMDARNVRHDVPHPSPVLNYGASVPQSLNGFIYQPRGAYINYGPGATNINSALRIITGAIWTQGGGQVVLLPTAVPITTYKPALIQ